MQQRGEISALELQPRFPLYVACLCYVGSALPLPNICGHDPKRVAHYVADFAYVDSNGNRVIEDVKGMRLPLYKHKVKHLLLQSGITVREVR